MSLYLLVPDMELLSLCSIPRPRVAIIGSREQLCIHGEVSKKETNAEKVLSFEAPPPITFIIDFSLRFTYAEQK